MLVRGKKKIEWEGRIGVAVAFRIKDESADAEDGGEGVGCKSLDR